jgi:Cu/Ag efflux protein CusF
MNFRIFAILSFFAFFALFAFVSKSMAGEVFKSSGVVNKVDLKTGKANLTMEAVPSLKWPKMTMDFEVQDKSALEHLSAGQKVDFDFTEKAKGRWVITKITPAK